MKIRYEITAGEIGEIGVVDSFRQLMNRLKPYEGQMPIKIDAYEDTTPNAGRLQKDKPWIDLEDKGIEVN
jgi:hypothetical protein